VERPDLVLAPPRAPLHVHLRVETRVLVVRLVPGFDDMFLRRILVMDGEGDGGEESEMVRTEEKGWIWV
jgi:hypothetical protein